MKQILLLKAQISEINCDKELGWLQLRLLVLNLLNTMVPLAYDKKSLTLVHVKDMQSLYTQYLQIPFSALNDTTLHISVKNEVIRRIDELQEQIAASAA